MNDPDWVNRDPAPVTNIRLPRSTAAEAEFTFLSNVKSPQARDAPSLTSKYMFVDGTPARSSFANIPIAPEVADEPPAMIIRMSEEAYSTGLLASPRTQLVNLHPLVSTIRLRYP